MRGIFLENVRYFHRTADQRFVYPIRDSSTALAASRPSRIAHTTRDWPRLISPAAKTRGTEEAYPSGFVATFVLWSTSTLKASVTYFWLPRNPAAIRTRSAGITFSLPSTGTIVILPVFSSFRLSSFTTFALHTFPFLSAMNSFTVV